MQSTIAVPGADGTSTAYRQNLSVGAAAQYLGVSESFLNKARVTGTGPRFSKLGSRCFYRLTDLDSWVEAHLRQSTSDEKGDPDNRTTAEGRTFAS